MRRRQGEMRHCRYGGLEKRKERNGRQDIEKGGAYSQLSKGRVKVCDDPRSLPGSNPVA
jgi:hypothetical protein